MLDVDRLASHRLALRVVYVLLPGSYHALLWPSKQSVRGNNKGGTAGARMAPEDTHGGGGRLHALMTISY